MKKIEYLFIICLLSTLFQTKTSYAQLSNLHNFNTSDGKWPYNDAQLIIDNYLYGITTDGGANESGVIYKIKLDGSEYSLLFEFSDPNGRLPYGGLITDGTFLYGTTSHGGPFGDNGIIFKIEMDGSGFEIIVDFNTTNAYDPLCTLLYDGTFLYGTTRSGGDDGYGTLFKVNPDGTGYATLINFNDVEKGSYPFSGVVTDGTYLYGTTSEGGANNLGLIYKIKTDGTEFEKLLDFDGTNNGSLPYGAPLLIDDYLFGMTYTGGTNNFGTAYKIKIDGSDYQNLIQFNGIENGKWPYGSFTLSGIGELCGLTSYGGANDRGTIFQYFTDFTDGSNYNKRFDFNDTGDIGYWPYGTLAYKDYTIYGTTNQGGLSNVGTIFSLVLILDDITEPDEVANTLVTVTPNPVSNVANILLNNKLTNATIKIINVYGDVSSQFDYITGEAGNTITLDLTHLSSGLYILQVLEKDKLAINKKIILQNN